MTPSTDRIEAHVLIAAPLERVWDLVTSPEHLGRWLGNSGAHVELRPGGALSLSFEGFGTFHGRVEAVDAPRRFAFRWLATVDVEDAPVPGNSTLTEFTLSER